MRRNRDSDRHTVVHDLCTVGFVGGAAEYMADVGSDADRTLVYQTVVVVESTRATAARAREMMAGSS